MIKNEKVIKFLKEKYLSFIFFIYFILIIYLKITGKLGNFLSPSMQRNALISGIIFLILSIYILISNFKYKIKWINLILILPIIIALNAGDGIFSQEFAKNKEIGLNRITRLTHKKLEENKRKEEQEQKEKNEKNKENAENKDKLENKEKNKIETKEDEISFDVQDETYQYLADNITYARDIERIKGKKIRLKGLIKKEVPTLSKKYSVIGKYLISCCAADSTFIGFVLDYDSLKLEENVWYELVGTVEETDEDTGITAIIKTEKIKKLENVEDKKEEMYIYPLYSYKGYTEKIQKYDKYFADPLVDKIFK